MAAKNRDLLNPKNAHASRVIAPALLVLCGLSGLTGLTGCASLPTWLGGTSNPDESTAEAKKAGELDVIKESMQKVQADSKAAQGQVAHLTHEVQALRESLMHARRQIEILHRGSRSGLFESHTPIDVPASRDIAKATLPASLKPGTPAAPDKTTPLAAGAKGASAEEEHEDSDENTDEAEENEAAASPHSGAAGATADTSTVENLPTSLLADAEIKIQRAQYGEAVVSLSELQRKYPNNNDGGLSLLLLAECWYKLGESDNALVPLRSFYLKHPNSPDLLKGKLIEAQVNEKSGAREKASVVYKEIIALGPQTLYAQKARSGLARLRDAR